MKPLSPSFKIVLMVGVVGLHLGCFFLVNAVNHQRPDLAFWNLRTPLDDWIPYWGWTGVIYYLGDIYILLAGAFVSWRLERPSFLGVIRIYAVMIVAGAVIQLLLPATAPWPTNASSLQSWFHKTWSLKPHACLPSMHVALALFPALLGLRVFRSRWIKGAHIIFASAVSLSTLSLKEHYALDVLAGVVLALGSYALWVRGTASDRFFGVEGRRDGVR